jgi:AcrR family transcriptional regulator
LRLATGASREPQSGDAFKEWCKRDLSRSVRITRDPSARVRDPCRRHAGIHRERLTGARVDAIAQRARVNKRMIYHYFGDKDGLYLAVLEATYGSIRAAELDLHLTDRDPVDGMRELVLFTWRYFLAHPEFLSLLGTENLHKAAYLKRSKRIRELHSPLVGMISALLARGAEGASVPRRRRSGRALHHHRGTRLLLSLQSPHALDHLRPRSCGTEKHRGARAAHRRCRPQLSETVTHAHLPDPITEGLTHHPIKEEPKVTAPNRRRFRREKRNYPTKNHKQHRQRKPTTR